MAKTPTKTGKKSGKVGRPVRLCTERDIKTIEEMMLLGAKVQKICEVLDISTSTFYKWRKENKNVSQTIKHIQDKQQTEVEQSLYKRATGYTVIETTNSTKSGTIEKERHIPPDTASMIFFLTNADPKKWKNKQIHDVNAKPLVKRNIKRFDGIKAANNE